MGRAGWLVIKRLLVWIPAPQGGTELHVEVSLGKILKKLLLMCSWHLVEAATAISWRLIPQPLRGKNAATPRDPHRKSGKKMDRRRFNITPKLLGYITIKKQMWSLYLFLPPCLAHWWRMQRCDSVVAGVDSVMPGQDEFICVRLVMPNKHRLVTCHSLHVWYAAVSV